MAYFEYQGHRLFYEQLGEGSQTIVLLHGILMDTDVNRELGKTLAAQGFRILLLDLLGHGLSDKPQDVSVLRMDRYADQAIALLDHLKIQTAVFGGLSLGADVSMHAQLRHPTRVQGLMLEMPVLEHAVPGVVILLAPLLLSTRLIPGVVRPISRLIQKLPKRNKLAWDSVRTIFGNDPDAIASVLSGTLVGPIAPTVRERESIDVPTLIIGHPNDVLHPFTDAEKLSKQIPGAQFVAAESIFELRDRPERLSGVIASFMKTAWQPKLKVA
ncbi:MAG: alpha/beta hydrolase [Gammaproteobacteria bacterium]|nr:alpha/beta hydrolase [Gammaproteobacteria bacterium]